MAIQEKALRMKATPSDGALWERIPDAATLEVGAGIKSTLTTLNISTINTSGLLSIYAEAAGSVTGPRIQLGGSALGTAVQEAITFSIDGTEYMRVDGDFAGRIKGNVGIRTSAAAYPLDVSGVTRVGVNGTAAAPALIIGSTETNTGLFNAGSDVLGFSTAGSERMRIDSTGLGVGATPDTKLHVATGAAVGTAIAKFANTTTSMRYFVSNATPEGAITGNVGDECTDTTTGTLYKKTSGSGNTGWTALAAGGGMAIGGSITSATAGSVLFAGAAGVLAQDNANFFWDDSNNRLYLGGTSGGADPGRLTLYPVAGAGALVAYAAGVADVSGGGFYNSAATRALYWGQRGSSGGVVGGANEGYLFISSSAGASALAIGSHGADSPVYFVTNAVERARITSDGLGVFTSATVNDSVNVLRSYDGGGGIKITNTSAGSLASAYVGGVNDGGKFGILRVGGSGATGLGTAVQNRTSVDTDSASGISFITRTAATDFRWYLGGVSVSEEKMRLTSTGLGIFNTAPSYPLDVTGVARVNTDGTAAAPALIVGSSETNTGLFNAGSDVLGIATAGVERARLTAPSATSASLRVGTTTEGAGIYSGVPGVSNPVIGGEHPSNGSALALQGSAATATGASSGGYLGLGGSGRGDVYRNATWFGSLGVERMRIEGDNGRTAGNVGIGDFSATGVPTKFAVQADGSAGTVAISMGATSDGNTGFFHPSADQIGFAAGGTEIARVNTFGLGVFAAATSSYALEVAASSGSSAGFSFNALSQFIGTRFGTLGGLGISAESPGAATGAQVFLGASLRGDASRSAIVFESGGNEYARVDGDYTSGGHVLGNFGIGSFRLTGVPTKLTVQADGSASTVVISMGSTSDGNTGFFHPAADQIGYAVGGSEIARMTATGLGVFNTAPSYPLDVTGVVRVNTDGTAAAPAVIVGSSETNTGLFNAGSDVLGIATAGVERVRWSSTAATGVVFNNGLADYDFRVNGDTIADVFVVDASIDTVLVRGYRLGRAGSSTSDTNTAFGLSALGSASGTDNTAFGSNALLAAGAATGNTAFGANALDSVSTGGANTAVGANAGTAFTTASDSTAVGSGALPLSTQGQMTAVGSGALSTVSTGLRCTAVGYNALAALDTNSDSTAVGHQAGANATGGSGTFVGANAGNGVTSGTQCTALGQGALTTATFTGSNVTCLGYNAEPSTSSVSNEITLGDANVTTLRCATTSITAISDARDKTEIRDLELGLDFIEKLRPRRFRWKKRDLKRGTPAERPTTEGHEEAGFIAQELDAAQTEASADWVGLVLKNNPERLEASQGKLIPILVKALQELSARAQELSARVRELEFQAAQA